MLNTFLLQGAKHFITVKEEPQGNYSEAENEQNYL